MPQKYKILTIPLVSFFVILSLFLFLVQFLYGRIFPLNQQITESKLLQAQLSEKIAQLTQLNQQTLDLSDNAYTALPDTNPAALAIFQLRKMAGDNQIVLNNVSIGRSHVEGEVISRALIEFDAEGEYQNMVAMFEQLRTTAPIINVEGIKISRVSDTTVDATASLVTFWAPLPQAITTYTEPLVSLSAEELDVLTEIGEFQQPEFAGGQPSEESARVNPFSIE